MFNRFIDYLVLIVFLFSYTYSQSVDIEGSNANTLIEVIDEELYKKSKQYLTLGQANKLLVNKSIITVKEKHDQSLKKLLLNYP